MLKGFYCQKKLRLLKYRTATRLMSNGLFFERVVNIGGIRSKTGINPLALLFTKRALYQKFRTCNEPCEKSRHVFHILN